MRSYRRFAKDDDELATLWHMSIEITDEVDWSIGGPIGRGESGSFHISLPGNRRGVCKPSLATDGTPRAAHEKIAADLAYFLGLPVPATCLWSNAGSRYMVSLWAFPQALTWEEARPRLTANFFRNAAATFSAGRVFHTWIGDTDHGGNEGNVIVNADSSDKDPAIAFIDHAFSLSQNANFEAAPVIIVPMAYVTHELCDHAATVEMVGAINQLEAKMIENVIRRVPQGFLPEARGEAIVRGLLRRRAELLRLFGVD